MKKKLLLALSLLAIMTVLFAITISAAEPVEAWDVSQTSSDNVTATLYDDYSLVISGTGNMTNWRSYDTPWYSYRSYIGNVTIENGVTSIGNYAFLSCTSLTSVTIGNGVTSIGVRAFSYCYNLTEINFNAVAMDDLRHDTNAFYGGLGLEGEGVTVRIGKDVTKIPAYLFYPWGGDNSGIKSIVFEEGSACTSIGSSAFYNCISLTSVTIPDSVTSIGNGVFSNCDSLTSVTIGNGVTSIDSSAFRYCTSLTSITIPDSVASIGNYAFGDCDSLTSITIPDSVTSIGSSAFNGCTSLTSITVDENNESYKSIDGNLYTKDGKTLIQYAVGKTDSSFVIPEGVISIGAGAFHSCDNLTSVTIPDSVTSIGGYAFYSCTNLTSVTIPDSVTSIGDFAFAYCTSLTSVTFEEGSQLTNIGKYAFNGCTSLTSIAIPDGVTAIRENTFEDCENLTSVEIPDSVTVIEGFVFSGCTSLIRIAFGAGVASIGYDSWGHMFEDCNSLLEIVVDSNNTVFASQNGVLYTQGMKTLIFYPRGKGELNFIVPNSVTNIERYAFDDCDRLKSVVISEGVTSISTAAFIGCDNLTSVVIPEGVTSIGSCAFQNCYNLTSITVEENNESYKSIDGNLYTKDGKTLIQYAIGKTDSSFVIPEGVTTIGDYAFYKCTSLTSITIPDSITSIGSCAFQNCYNLTSITIPEGVTSIGNSAFYNCTSLTIYCEAESQSSGWDSGWNNSNCPVIWGYFDEEACLDDIFTFKGYSFNEAGSVAVGFDIDYEALAKYEEKTGKTLEIGVLFAGYDNLGGKQPLGEDGQAIALDAGRVVKADLTSFNYPSYDFVLTDIVDSIKDVKLVISAYIFDGEAVWYEQEKGLSDTVSGISYNEAKESVKE